MTRRGLSILLALLLLLYAPCATAAAAAPGALDGGGSPDILYASGMDVTFRLIGSTLSSGDVDLGVPGGYRGAEYVTWIGTRSYTMPEGATVYDLFVKALADAGILANGQNDNYVSAIFAPEGYKLAEFTNGKRSGWMYTINGSHPGYGLKEQSLTGGDEVIWHYVNDYAHEVHDWFDDAEYPAQGNGTYYNRWLLATDDPYTEPAPTLTPTPTPTPSPTSAPGQTPTPSPTSVPGQTPTPSPTSAPGQTQTPTPSPTSAPGQTPTPSPTPLPAQEPTPTQTPTPSPTPDQSGGTSAYEAALSGVLAHIQANTPNPEVGSVGGEWAVLALARGGVWDETVYMNWLENLKTTVQDTGPFSDVVLDGNKVTLHPQKYTENERVILALSSIGIDASAWNGWDFVAALTDKEEDGVTYKAVWQGINGAIFALIALDARGYLGDDPQLRSEYVDYILDNQDPGAGWSISGTAKQDMTAMGVQALAPYYDSDSRVKSAVDAAVSYLSAQQSGAGDVGGTSEGTAQTIVALAALGIDPHGDPRFVKNGNSLIDGLLAYRQPDGSFKHLLDGSSGVNQMSTEQAAYALAAYDRFARGQNRLYDMSDAPNRIPGGTEPEPTDPAVDKTALNAAIGHAESLNEADCTPDSWAMLQAALEAARLTAANEAAAQGEVDAVGEALLAAINALVPAGDVTPADKTALNAAIARAEALIESPGESAYTASSWSVMAAALNAAKVVAENPEAAQTETNDAAAALTAAVNALVPVGVGPGPDDDKLHVSFRLIGATLAARDVNISLGSYDSVYVTWIPTRAYTMNSGALVYDLFVQALADAGMIAEGQDRNYVSAILAPSSLGGYKLAEFTNGRYSGWMYTIDGQHPGYGLKEQALSDGDEVVWHYINDYRHEVADWFDDLDYPALGDGSWWGKWLDAPDVFGGASDNLPSNPGAAVPSPTAAPGGSGGVPGTGGGDDPTADENTPSGADGVVSVSQPSRVTSVEYQATVTEGTAKAEVKTDDIQSAIQTAAQKGDAAVAVVVAGTENARQTEITLPKAAVSEVQGAKLELTLNTPAAAVTFSSAALATVGAAAGDTVRVVLAAAVSADGKTALDLDVYVGNAAVHELGGLATVSLSYVPEAGIQFKDYDLLTVYSVNEDGSLREVKGARFNSSTGAMLFAATHFSRFVVSEWISPFADITKDDWFYRAVRYSHANGLMGGTGETAFSPKTNLTRAMLITILAREANAPTGATADGGAWYSAAAEWGVANGITDGERLGDSVTRQEFAAILYRHARRRGRDVSRTTDLADYADAGEISDWALEAVRWANAAGILSGRTETTLAPTGVTTRAEAAALLQRYIAKTP
jgi:hypothetical protein